MRTLKEIIANSLKWLGVIIFGVIVFCFVSQLPQISTDALAVLAGTVIGALIATASNYWEGIAGRRHQLKMAALDRRLQAHQEAFALWRKLITYVHDENKIIEVVGECQEWWNNNCLYLEPDAREKFRFAYICAASHKDYTKDTNNPGLVTENWANITDAGEAIVKGVALPTLGEDEAKVIENEKKA